MPDIKKQKKPKLLLHVCCIGCGAYVAKVMATEYDTTLYFYNPSIFPEKEYAKRLEETRRVAEELGLPLMTGDYDHEEWLGKVKGHEKDHEGGERCQICYRGRLEQCAQVAIQNKFPHFTSTLTVSPHKKAEEVNKIGTEIASKYNLNFVSRDFKKQDGFKKACAISKELNLYRQNYCGCEFSIRD